MQGDVTLAFAPSLSPKAKGRVGEGGLFAFALSIERQRQEQKTPSRPPPCAARKGKEKSDCAAPTGIYAAPKIGESGLSGPGIP
ncbi:hypothetical protein GCM10027430_34820 [Lysobacter tyrosinilyticus]